MNTQADEFCSHADSPLFLLTFNDRIFIADPIVYYKVNMESPWLLSGKYWIPLVIIR